MPISNPFRWLFGLTAGRIPFVNTAATYLDDDPGLAWNDSDKSLTVNEHTFVNEAVTGNFPPAAVDELVVKNTLADANTLALRNLDTEGYSTLTCRTADGHEVLAVGYGNPDAFAFFADQNYIQSWSGVSTAADPKRFFISMDGNYGSVGSGVRFYQRQSFEPEGDIKFWQLLPSTVAQKETLWVDAINDRVGVGYNDGDAPAEKLHVVEGGVLIDRFGGAVPAFIGRGAGGSLGSPSQTPTLTTVGALQGRGYTDSGAYTATQAALNLVSTEAFTSSATGTRMDFRVTPTGSTTMTTALQVFSTGPTAAGTMTATRFATGAQTLTTTGTSNALAVTNSFVRLNNASALTINGIAAGVDGQELDMVLVNSTGGATVTINHNSGSASAGCAIITHSGANLTFNFRAGIRLRYDTTSGVWRIISYVTT